MTLCVIDVPSNSIHSWLSAEHGVRELMRLGAEVEVIAPEAVRTHLAQALRNALRHYSTR
jgi:predicted DNA-binding transcriptional regulator YafY